MMKTMKTTTLTGQMAVSKTEAGMDYIQVLPDNPQVGIVKPFSGSGRGQLLENGTFDFVRKRRIRRKPVLKQLHSTVSFGADGTDRYTFCLPSEQRGEFARLLKREATVAAKFMNNRDEA